MKKLRQITAFCIVLGLGACNSTPPKKPPTDPVFVVGKNNVSGRPCEVRAPAQEDPSKRGHYQAGGLYAAHISDSKPDDIPDVDCIPEPVVVDEPRSAIGNSSPYTVLGKRYQVMPRANGYVERGGASYYGSKFHGRLTSNREVYDMYAFTAAHKSLPLPSFVLVTNLENGRSVVVRVNDRGPFHEGRVIDLSYAAAVKLDIVQKGTGQVEVRALTEADNKGLLASRRQGESIPAVVAGAAPVVVAATQMDQLVGSLPNTPPAVVAVASKTEMDDLLASLPADVPVTATGAVDVEHYRYRVSPNGDGVLNAEAFDEWMRVRGLRIVPAHPSKAVADVGVAEVANTVPPAAVVADNSVLLQIGSFSNRDNASRARDRLSAAGIADIRISDVISAGRTFWRLQVGVSDRASAESLAIRIAGLGLGHPQVVRE